jgi:hypothetical protein
MNDQGVPTEEAEDIRWSGCSKADIDRARTTLSMLLGVIAILRSDCGCRSPQGILPSSLLLQWACIAKWSDLRQMQERSNPSNE